MSASPIRVDLWWTAVDRPAAAALGPEQLDDEERRRAVGLRVESARRTFVAGRTLLRTVLAERLGVPPDRLAFAVGPHGRPRLASPEDAGLDFNLSHSHGLIAAAVCRHAPVGLDLERWREVPAAERLARRFFAPAELAAVQSRAGAERDRAFLAIWTAKEAWLKATGLGISVRLASVEVEPDPDRPPRLLSLPDDDPDRWTMVRVPLPIDAVCTLALAGELGSLEIREWRP